jgi:Legionella pneumophila major outer membrane protein precursor
MRRILNMALVLGVGASCFIGSGLSASGLDRIMCGHFGVWGEALYVRPTGEGPAFAQVADVTEGTGQAITLNTTTTLLDAGLVSESIKRRHVCRDYEWGFRVGGAYMSENRCSYAALSGSRVRFTNSTKAHGLLTPVLAVRLPTLGITTPNLAEWTDPLSMAPFQIDGLAKASHHLTYWDIDLRAGQYLMRGCCSSLHAFGGVRYIDVSETTDVAIAGTGSYPLAAINQSGLQGPQFLVQHEKREFSGAGPMIGLGASFNLRCNFYARCEAALLAVIGNAKGFITNKVEIVDANNLENTFSASQRYLYDSCVSVCPAFDMRLAVGYQREWCRFVGDLEVGYYLNHYWGVLPSQAASTAGTVQNVTNDRADIGYGGPYIGLNVSY